MSKDPTTTTEHELEDLSSLESNKPIVPFTLSFHSRKVLSVCWLGYFLCQLDGTIVSTTMSNIASNFNQSHLVTWIATSYLLTSTAFQPLYGKTSDILGRKTLLLIGQVFFTLGILLSALSINVQTLAISRAIAGIGGAGMMALTNIIITDLVPLSQRSVYVGYGSLISGVSQMLGGPIGGVCIVTIGWRMMFLIQLPFLIIAIFYLLKLDIKVDHIPNDELIYTKENLKRIDFGGIITLNLSVSSIIFLLSTNDETSKLYKVSFTLLFIISSISYCLVEKYIAVETIVDLDVLKGTIGALGLVNGVNSLGLYMVLFITPLYLQIIQGISVSSVGFYTVFFVVSCSIGAIISGFVIRRHDSSEAHTMVGAVRTSFQFFIIQAIGFLILFFQVSLTDANSQGLTWRFVLMIGEVIAGFGAGGFGVGIVVYVVGKVGKKGQASANTVISLIRQLGNVLGVSISLSSYSKRLSSQLHLFFIQDENKVFVDKLIKDSAFIRDGLPKEYVWDVLFIYKSALTYAFHPAIVLTLAGAIGLIYINKRIKSQLLGI